MIMYALVMPTSSGFKLLEDRLLHSYLGHPLIFETQAMAKKVRKHDGYDAEILPVVVTLAEVST